MSRGTRCMVSRLYCTLDYCRGNGCTNDLQLWRYESVTDNGAFQKRICAVTLAHDYNHHFLHVCHQQCRGTLSRLVRSLSYSLLSSFTCYPLAVVETDQSCTVPASQA